jgi:microcystin-dependent protein
MAEPFLGQITLFGCNFAPVNWMMCQGQLLPIRQYSALFSLLGTNFGGDGRVTFGLPDLRGRVPIGQGQLAGGGLYNIGDTEGIEQIALTVSTMPPHNHALPAYVAAGTVKSPAGALPAKGPAKGSHGNETQMNLFNTAAANVALAPKQVSMVTGSGVPHDNRQPLLALNWCIALNGTFPTRS